MSGYVKRRMNCCIYKKVRFEIYSSKIRIVPGEVGVNCKGY